LGFFLFNVLSHLVTPLRPLKSTTKVTISTCRRIAHQPQSRMRAWGVVLGAPGSRGQRAGRTSHHSGTSDDTLVQITPWSIP
jgi:hypothetical protein